MTGLMCLKVSFDTLTASAIQSAIPASDATFVIPYPRSAGFLLAGADTAEGPGVGCLDDPLEEDLGAIEGRSSKRGEWWWWLAMKSMRWNFAAVMQVSHM